MEMWKQKKIEKNKEKCKKYYEKKGRHECQKPEMSLRLFRNTRGCEKEKTETRQS